VRTGTQEYQEAYAVLIAYIHYDPASISLHKIQTVEVHVQWCREALFREHPDIVNVLCKDAPRLIETLFDGLLWHSQVQARPSCPRAFVTKLQGPCREMLCAWAGTSYNVHGWTKEQ
jgi:hypothetical protein